MAEKKEKQYVSDNAQLMPEWDWEKNNELGFNPQELTCGSHKKPYWKCEKGHTWYAAVSDRAKGTGCPYCSGQKVLKGFNDLATTNPNLFLEWNDEKNGYLSAENVAANSHKTVWWKCFQGHEWQSTIRNRNKGQGCPYCAKNKQ